MESSLPKCKCGADVHVEFYQVACYDDGGGLDSVEEDYEFMETCYACRPISLPQPTNVDNDELPF